MKAGPRDLWAAALESGEYEQTTGALITDHPEGLAYCCLGVACEVYMRDHDDLKRIGERFLYRVIVPDDFSPEEAQYQGYEEGDVGEWWYEHDDGDLPRVVANWLGIESNPLLPDEFSTSPESNRAIYLNDQENASFAAIAARVRRQPGE